MSRRLSQDEWETIRAEREAGASLSELAAKFGLTHEGIRKRAKAEGWGDGTDVADAVRRKVAAKVAGIPANPEKRRAAIDAAAERAAKVVERHKRDWEDHRTRFGVIPKDFERGKEAKISAEMLRIRQDGERKAWGLDEAAAQPTIVIERSFGR